MTKADKINAVIALSMMAVLLAAGKHLRGNTLIFSLGFPLALYCFYFWLGRARTAQWLEKNDHCEIISRRPMTERLLNGFFGGCLIWLSCKVVPRLLFLFSDPAGWGAAAFLLFVLGLLVFCFLLGAGPRRLCFDVRRHQYSIKQGILFLTWKQQGQVSGGEFYVSRTRSGHYQIRFRAQRWQRGLPIASCTTDEEARSEAWQIADKLGLGVRRRGVN